MTDQRVTQLPPRADKRLMTRSEALAKKPAVLVALRAQWSAGNIQIATGVHHEIVAAWKKEAGITTKAKHRRAPNEGQVLT